MFCLVATACFVLIALPPGIYLASLKNPGMIYAFLAVPALFLLFFMRLCWINRLRNRSTLQLETLPGLIGGSFSGIATVPLSFPKDTTFHVKLRCEVSQRVHTASGTRGDVISVLTNSQNGAYRSDVQTSTVDEEVKLVTSTKKTLELAGHDKFVRRSQAQYLSILFRTRFSLDSAMLGRMFSFPMTLSVRFYL